MKRIFILLILTMYIFCGCDTNKEEKVEENKEVSNNLNKENYKFDYCIDVLNDNFKTLNKKEIDQYKYYENYNLDSYVEYIKLKNELLNNDDHEDMYEDYVDEIMFTYGNDYKLRYEIVNKKIVDERELEIMSTAIREYYSSLLDNQDEDIKSLENLCEKENVLSSDIEELIEKYKKSIHQYENVKVNSAYKIELLVEVEGKNKSDSFIIEQLIIANVNDKNVYIDAIELEDDYICYFTHPITPYDVYSNLLK